MAASGGLFQDADPRWDESLCRIPVGAGGFCKGREEPG